MPEYVFDEAFEHRLERTLREMGNEAVRPFDPYETTQLVVTSTRIGGVPFVQPPSPQQPAPPPLYPPPLYAPPQYQDYPEPAESRRWPLLAALALLIAALVFAGFATGFINMPSNFGITIGSPAPAASPSSAASPTPVATGSPEPTSTPGRTRRPRRPRNATAVPATLQPQTSAPETVNPSPTEAPAPTPTIELPTVAPTTQAVEPTVDPAVTSDGAAPQD